MSININVDYDEIDKQMKTLVGIVEKMTDFDCSMTLSSFGSTQSQAKYAEITEKMQQLLSSYKQLLDNSIQKAYAAVDEYNNADETLKNALPKGYIDTIFES